MARESKLDNPDWMPVITLWQPWASWVIEGRKRIETRTHDRLGSLATRPPGNLVRAGNGDDCSVSSRWRTLLVRKTQRASIGDAGP